MILLYVLLAIVIIGALIISCKALPGDAFTLDDCVMVVGDPLTLNGKMVRFENEKDDPFYGLTINEAYAKLRSVGGFGKPKKKYYPLNEEQSFLLEAWDKGKNMTDLYYEALRRNDSGRIRKEHHTITNK